MTDYSPLSRHELIERLCAAEAELERIQASKTMENRRTDPGNGPSTASTELRCRAEVRWPAQQAQVSWPLTAAEGQRLIHELHLHRIELELQNKELQAACNRLAQSLKRYTDLYDFAPVAYFTLTGDNTIQEVNLAGAALLDQERSSLIGRRLELWVSESSRPAFKAFLSQLTGSIFQETCEVTLDLAGISLRHVRFEGTWVGFGADRCCRLIALNIAPYKQLEKALRTHEQQLFAFFHAAPVGMGVTVRRIFQQVNDYFYQILGYRRDEIIGQSTRIVYPSDEAFERIGQEMQYQIERTGLAIIETQARCKDGRLLDVLLQAAPLVPNQLELGRVFTILDITKRKQAEEALRASEQRYRTLVELLPYGVQENDIEGRITFANPALERLHGWREGSIVGQFIWDFPADAAERQRLRDYLQFLVHEQPSPTAYFSKDRCADGASIDVQVDWTYKRDAQGQVQGFISVITDITERQRMMESLRQVKERLELVIEGADVGLYDVDLRTDEVVLNERYLQMLGYAPGELVLTTLRLQGWRDLIHPADLLRVAQAAEKAEQNRSQFNEEYRMLHKSGTWIWVLDRGKGFDWDEHGKPRRLTGTHLDITERKQAEEELRAREALLRTIMENSPDPIFMVDRACRLLYVNPASLVVLNAFGSQPPWTQETLIGKTPLGVCRTNESIKGIRLKI
ncbi:MAG: PAS domain S-box protein [Gammaproteobacteria bacterium]|nr:PAS domain S-box protein [Gammaproteobacteria bacterium]